jgi:hypothetical protein
LSLFCPRPSSAFNLSFATAAEGSGGYRATTAAAVNTGLQQQQQLHDCGGGAMAAIAAYTTIKYVAEAETARRQW